MDTQSLVVVAEDLPPYAEKSTEVARLGARIAFELLRTPSIPSRVALTDKPLLTWNTEGRGRKRTERGKSHGRRVGRKEPGESLYEYTSSTLVISYGAVARASFLGVRKGDQKSVNNALSFVAGYAAAQYVMDETIRREQNVSWFNGTGEERERVAALAASVASGFTLAPKKGQQEPRDEVLTFYLQRLVEISEREGIAALWRGALGHSARAFIREVRLSPFRGIIAEVHEPGLRIDSLDGIIPLLNYAQGRGEWPFRPGVLGE